MVQVTVRTPVRPTEVQERVEAAITSLFPGVVTMDGDQLVLQGTDVDALRDRIWEMEIIDAVRRALMRGVDGQHLRLQLSKQAAVTGRVALPISPNALGELDILFTVEDGDPWLNADGLAWWICPLTEDGKIVEPTPEISDEPATHDDTSDSDTASLAP